MSARFLPLLPLLVCGCVSPYASVRAGSTDPFVCTRATVRPAVAAAEFERAMAHPVDSPPLTIQLVESSATSDPRQVALAICAGYLGNAGSVTVVGNLLAVQEIPERMAEIRTFVATVGARNK